MSLRFNPDKYAEYDAEPTSHSSKVKDKVKQVIVVRTRFPDHTHPGVTTGLRTGKYIAQGSHAALAFLASRLAFGPTDEYPKALWATAIISPEEREWLTNGRQTKVVLRVESDDELVAVYNKAIEAGLTAHLITDAGLTEFKGVPTRTAVAIGPHRSSKIDPITKDLRLL